MRNDNGMGSIERRMQIIENKATLQNGSFLYLFLDKDRAIASYCYFSILNQWPVDKNPKYTTNLVKT